MKRAISPEDAQNVQHYYNQTADDIGIALPLAPDGWHAVKQHLREKYAEGVPGDWSDEQKWLHVISISDLAIDPDMRRKGFSAKILSLASWIFSPSDRHGLVSETLRELFLIAVALLVGTGTAQLIHVIFGLPPDALSLGLSFIALVLSGYFISADTNMGAIVLFLLLADLYHLANVRPTHDLWLWQNLLSIAALAPCVLLFGFIIGPRRLF